MDATYEKAVDIATQLMSAQLQKKDVGNLTQAQAIGDYFLKLADTIYSGLKAHA